MKLKCIILMLLVFGALSMINAQILPKPPTPGDGESGNGGGARSISKPTISAFMNDPASIDIYFRTANSQIEVTITNDFGEIVYKQQINTSSSPHLKINISALPTDHYTIHCNNLLTGGLTQFIFDIE